MNDLFNFRKLNYKPYVRIEIEKIPNNFVFASLNFLDRKSEKKKPEERTTQIKCQDFMRKTI